MKLKLLSTVLAAALLSSCAGYNLGNFKPQAFEGVNSLGVPTFKNETLEPRIETLVTNAVIKQIQQDGTYSVDKDEAADAILEGTITKIERRRARSVRGNVIATREFDIVLFINYTVTDRVSGRTLLSRTVRGDTSFFINEDLQQDERQAIPLAAESAAVRLVSQISEGG